MMKMINKMEQWTVTWIKNSSDMTMLEPDNKEEVLTLLSDLNKQGQNMDNVNVYPPKTNLTYEELVNFEIDPDSKDDFLSVYVDSMGVWFWENTVVESDRVRFRLEEDFGISHNRQMDIEAFYDIMSEHLYSGVRGCYNIIRDENLVKLLKEEFKGEQI